MTFSSTCSPTFSPTRSSTTSSSTSPARSATLAALRHAVAGLEGAGAVDLPKPPLTFGAEPADTRSGGLARGAVHDLYADTPDDGGALRGFGLALAARLNGPVLLVEDRLSVLEHGSVHGPGLSGFGLDPGRVLVVAVREARDLLWAVEEGLGCPALAGVVALMSGPARPYTLTASRRLALVASRTGVTALILRFGAEDLPTAALTRWRIRGLASEEAGGVGPPAFEARLVRRRQGGPPLLFRLAWSRHAFHLLPLPGDQSAPPAGRTGAASF